MNSNGLICIKDQLNIEYVVCKIDYYLNEDESYSFVFTPYYDVIDVVDKSIFQGIPGLDLSLCKEQYIRDNKIPCFISERVPSIQREDYIELLDSVGLEYMDPIEYLKRTKQRYSGDSLYVKEYQERKRIILEDEIHTCNTIGGIKLVLDSIAKGDCVYLMDGTHVNSISLFKTLYFLYERSIGSSMDSKTTGIEQAKEMGKYKGRKPIEVDYLLFEEQFRRVEKNEITAKEAARNIGISIDKYYRLRKEYKK